MPNGPRYHDDFYARTQYQAEVLRTMAVADDRFDRENVVEEIETLGRSERDAVRSQVRRIIEHLLKLAYSPAEPPRYSWMETVLDARQTLSDKISPTLRQDAEENLDKLYADGRKRAALHQYGEPSGRCVAANMPLFARRHLQGRLVPTTAGSKAMTRDFIGHGGDPPYARWPGEARIAVNFVINFEEGSELSYPAGDGVSETALTEMVGSDLSGV